MTSRRGFVRLMSWVNACALLVSSCGGDSHDVAISEQRVELPEGAVAQVGDQTVAAASIGRIARAQGVTREQARELAVSDALFAAGAADFLPPERIRVVQRAEAGRSLYAQLKQQAEASGIPTDAEIDVLTKERWLTYDRPEAVRTSHAVVLLSADGDTNEAAARALAERIRGAAQGAQDAAAFESAAKAVPVAEGLEVKIEALPPVALDGRIVNPDAPAAPGQGFDQEFAKAAHAIAEVGELSPVSRSRFGFHVIYLAERLPAHRVELAERRRLLGPEVIARRVRAAEQQLLQQAQAAHPVEISRAVDSLTSVVQVRP